MLINPFVEPRVPVVCCTAPAFFDFYLFFFPESTSSLSPRTRCFFFARGPWKLVSQTFPILSPKIPNTCEQSNPPLFCRIVPFFFCRPYREVGRNLSTHGAFLSLLLSLCFDRFPYGRRRASLVSLPHQLASSFCGLFYSDCVRLASTGD